MRNLLIVSLSFLLTSCGTMISGSYERVTVQSDPPGAIIYLNGFEAGKTPTQFRLEKKKTHHIEVVKSPEEKRSFVLSPTINSGIVFLDILFGLIPLLVDMGTGGWYSFDQPVIMARFDQPKPEHESATSKFEPVTVTVLAGQMSLILDGQVGIRFLSSDLSKSSLAFIGLNAVLDAEGKPLSPDNVRVAVNDQLQIISSTGDRYHLKVTSELGDRITLLITQASK